MKHCALIFLLISSDILQNQIYPNGPKGHFANSPLVDCLYFYHAEAPFPSPGRRPGKVDLRSYHLYHKYISTVYSYQFYGNNVMMFMIINLYGSYVKNFP